MKAIVSLFLVAAWAGIVPAIAPARADTLRAGTPAEKNFTFLPLRIGVDRGAFKKYDLDVEVTDFGGGAKLQQAFAAGAVDVAVSAGTDMAFIAKGAPVMAIANMGNRPMLGLVVAYDSPLKNADDVKGKKVGVTTVGSLTEWLMRRFMMEKGWAADSVTILPIGSEISTNVALLTTGEVDAIVSPPSLGLQLALTKRGRVLLPVFDPGAPFVAEALYAANPLIKDRPDTVRRFLKAWFENMDWMQTHKADVVEMARVYTKYTPEVESQEYDLVMPIFSRHGRFQPAALQTLQQSFMDMKMLPAPPDMSKLYTEAYLPAK
jgi:ABC-type nitrate/sulfonate/bicarbonate transport system substrate-binding protein